MDFTSILYFFFSVPVTSNSEKAAIQALKASDWHLEGAFDVFYSQPQVRSHTDARHLEELYNRYKGTLGALQCFWVTSYCVLLFVRETMTSAAHFSFTSYCIHGIWSMTFHHR